MEHDEEFTSPNPNGRITVTISAPSIERGVTLALPIQQPKQTPNSDVTDYVTLRDDCWSEDATEVLIEAWGERYMELKRGNLKQNHWKEVADIVSSRNDYSKTPKTDNQCKNRIDTVKKKYKNEKQKISLSGGCSIWRFFNRMEELINPNVEKTSVFATGYEGRNVPMGIPVGVRPMVVIPHFREAERLKRKAVKVDYESRPETDGFRPGRYGRKEQKMEKELFDGNGNGNGKRSWGNGVREMSMAIMKLGEAYQEAESMKLEQMMEMEKYRMNLVKELELGRMRFMAKMQMEILDMKRKLKQGESHGK